MIHFNSAHFSSLLLARVTVSFISKNTASAFETTIGHDLCLTVHHRCRYSTSNTEEPTKCKNNLLIYNISSTCFGQSFAHLQERKTEIFTAYGIVSCCFGRQGFGERQRGTMCTVRRKYTVPRCRSPNPCLPQQQNTICCKNLSLTLLKMGKRLPETY